MRISICVRALVLAFIAGSGCGGGGDDSATGGGGEESSVDASTGGVASSSGDPSEGSSAADTDGSSSSGTTGDGEDDDTGPVDVVCDDGEVLRSPLPELPELARVEGIVRGEGVSLRFEPIDGARDYRVYVLPSADAVSTDGGLHVENATYRCAGDRAAIDLPFVQNGNLTVDTAIDGDVAGYARSEAESTLGYVFTI